MNRAQWFLIVASLVALAVASPIYCLEYRSGVYWSSGNGTIFDDHLRRPPDPILTLSETELVPPTLSGAGTVRVSGLYPRPGLAFGAGVIGGLLVPILLLVAAAYLALSGNGFIVPRRTATQKFERTESIVPPGYPTPRSERTKPEEIPDHLSRFYGVAALAGVAVPVLWIIDTPSMLLMMGLRFPVWLFALLLLRSCAR